VHARGPQLHETPPEATWALLKAEPLPAHVWEPAAGRGAIVNVLRQSGRIVHASDLIDYGIRGQLAHRDFLGELGAPTGCTAIVTNPPFGNQMAEAFVRKAITLVPLTVMLLRLAFLEGVGRDDILDRLTRVHVFKNRLPMMHRDGWAGPKSTSMVAFAWFVWQRGYRGATRLHRIRWEKLDGAATRAA
jgi:hypothetical protein